MGKVGCHEFYFFKTLKSLSGNTISKYSNICDKSGKKKTVRRHMIRTSQTQSIKRISVTVWLGGSEALHYNGTSSADF